jgi:casein kinase 1
MERVNIRVANKFILDRKVGSGSFGVIFHGLNTENNEEVAVKLEPTSAKQPQLLNEAKTLHLLRGGQGIPHMYWSGTEGEYNIMVMELLGQSIEDQFTDVLRKLSVITVGRVGGQILERLEYMHKNHIIHRDMKPENFLLGKLKHNLIYAIDFGLSKRFRDSKTLQHIPMRHNRSLTGTARYAAVNSHLGIELARRDDIESLAYILIYLATGGLPWQGVQGSNKHDKYSRILDLKQGITPQSLCKGLPGEFCKLLIYSKALRFEEEPDYAFCRGLLASLAGDQDFGVHSGFDWSGALEVAPPQVLKAKPKRKKAGKRRRKSTTSSPQVLHIKSRSCDVVRFMNPDDCDSNATAKIEMPYFRNRRAVMRNLEQVAPPRQKGSCRVF